MILGGHNSVCNTHFTHLKAKVQRRQASFSRLHCLSVGGQDQNLDLLLPDLIIFSTITCLVCVFKSNILFKVFLKETLNIKHFKIPNISIFHYSYHISLLRIFNNKKYHFLLYDFFFQILERLACKIEAISFIYLSHPIRGTLFRQPQQTYTRSLVLWLPVVFSQQGALAGNSKVMSG